MPAAAVVCLLALAVGSAPALAETLPVPSGFRLQGSNGYTIEAHAFQDPRGERSAVLVLVHRKGAIVSYATRANVTDTSFQADLGSVGGIDVHFVPTGEARPERSECGGRSIRFDSGRYEGVIDFEGEEGYSEAHVASARGEGRFFLELICSDTGSEGTGGYSPGALLTARHRGEKKFEFTARKNSPSRPARFIASIEERRGAVAISRVVGATAPPSAFTYDVPAGLATVDPPAPFAGGAVYRRGTGAARRWHGDLAVDFPGYSGVSLTGAGTRAGMIRAVQNPGHPFRASRER